MLATNPAAAGGYVFYDCETTGTSRSFDQITQIAAIRTDGEFNVVDPERDVISLRCRRLPWIVPSPGAMLLTGVGADELEHAPLSHYEMMRLVASTFEDWAPATFIGYNSLRFDEELLRRGLFATLHPAYLTSQRGCHRADAYTMLQVLNALAPGAIIVPEIDGRPSLKLGNVLRANAITFKESEAHEALADVSGTIALVKLMRERRAEIVDHMLRMASREAARVFIEESAILRHVTHFGAPHVATVKHVAANPANRNEVAIFDLAYDPAPFLGLSVEELAEALRASPRVLRSVKLNAQPALLPRGMLDGESFEIRPNIVDDYTVEARAVSISLASGFQNNVAEAMQMLMESYQPGIHVEEQIYSGGFPIWSDKRLSARFHQTPNWRDRHKMIGDLADTRLRTHALRLVYAECPAALPPAAREDLDAWLRERLLGNGDDLPYTTLHSACAEVESLAMLDSATGGNSDPARGGRTVAERLDEIEQYYLMLASGHQ